ncbi:MAG: hypothetical protein AB7P21_10840 [Lautropia sp.]
MALFIEIKAADGTVSRTRIEAGNNRFSVKSGDSYRVIDEATGFSPPGTAVKRLDNNVLVTGLERSGDDVPTRVELVEFYSVCSVGSPCQVEVQPEGGGAPVVVTSSSQPIGALADGSFVLYDPNAASSGAGAAAAGSAGAASADGAGTFDGIGMQKVLYGVGGLALVGLALAGGGGGGSDTAVSASPPAPAPGPAPSPAPAPGPAPAPAPGPSAATPPPVVAAGIATDGVVNATELAAGFTISGTVTAGAPGVNVSIAGGPANLAATVVGGTWSVVVPGGASLAQGAHAVTATIAEPGGQSGTGSFTVDTVGPTAPTIGPIATNNVVNIAEAAGGVTVSGTTEPGAALALTWGNATPQQTTANGAGAWSVLYAPGALPTVPGGVGSATLAVATADAAGNPGASQNAVVAFDLQAPAAPVISSATATATGIVLTGTAEAGSLVSVAVGLPAGTPVTQTATGGVWSATFTGPSSGTFLVTLSTTDAAGNPSVVGRQVFVINPPSADTDPAADLLGHDGQDLASALSVAPTPSDGVLQTADLLQPSTPAGTSGVSSGSDAATGIGPSGATLLASLIEPLHHGVA